MKVYKRVDERTQPGRILSAGIEGKHETEYVPGEWKHLRNIFVFETLEDAQASGIGSRTWVSETPETHPAPEYILSSWYIDEADFERFWSDPENYTGHKVFTPVGTVLCDELLLIHRVEEDEE